MALQQAYRTWHWTSMSCWPKQTTWRLDKPGYPTRYLKVGRTGGYPTLAMEAERLRWAAPWLPVPQVPEVNGDGDGDWLITTGIDGRPAVDLTDDPAGTVVALGEGLRRFHDSAPIDSCPFDFRLGTALQHVRRRVAAHLIDPAEAFNDDHAHLDVASAIAELHRLRPRDEDLVVCHGDYCPPNILITDWRAVGFVDLGELAVADRWCDLAIGPWSTTWNYGPGFEALYLAAYGAEPDPERQAFYRLLYDLSS